MILGGSAKAKIELFQNIAYQIKGTEVYNTMLANILPSPRVGSKGQTCFF